MCRLWFFNDLELISYVLEEMELKEILVEFQNLFTEFVKYIEVSPIDGFPKNHGLCSTATLSTCNIQRKVVFFVW